MWRHRTEYIHGMSADASNLLYFNSLFSFHPRATFFKPGPNQNRSGVVRTSLRWIIFGLDSFHYLLLIFNQYASEPIKCHYLEIVIMIGRLKFFSVLIGLFGTIAANEFDEKTKQMLDWQWVNLYSSDGNILESSDGNSIFRRKAGQEQTIKLNKSDFKKYVQSKTEVSYFHASWICVFPELKINKNI